MRHLLATRPLAASALVLTALVASPALAQQWAEKMFDKLDHNFETVARGSDTVYKFEVTNIYKEDIHLSSVRSSCGCTSPSIEVEGSPSNVIKTYEKGYIVAKFNTRTFTGLHSATLTVTIDKPYPAQVQLRVHGDIRSDVVFEPGSINFGSVDQGSEVEKSVSVTYAGYSGWKINDVRSASGSMEVELVERPRSSNRASYNLLVRLKPSAPPGILKEQLVLVTSDSRYPRIPLDVEGRVVPEISVAPANLVFNDVPLGEPASKRIIVRGKKPFKLTKVFSETPGFEFKTRDEEASDRHIVEVTYTPTSGKGAIKAPIVVETDLGESYTATCTAYATLIPAASIEGAAADESEATASEKNKEKADEKLAQGQ